MNQNKKIIAAVTGASGGIYARLLLERLIACQGIGEVTLIFSENGKKVAAFEQESFPLDSTKVRLYDNCDLFSPAASGSADYDAMVVVPCSVGTVGRIAAGVSADLIGRAADVMLKERKPLILVVRETPLSTIHLRNMTTLSESGAVILPASPSFYSAPRDKNELCNTVVDRVIKLLGLPGPRYQWGQG